MNARLTLATAVGISAVSGVVLVGERITDALYVAAFLLCALSAGAAQARHELIRAYRQAPDPEEMSPSARKQAELASEEAKRNLAFRAQRLTHLEQLEQYLEERRQAREAGR